MLEGFFTMDTKNTKDSLTKTESWVLQILFSINEGTVYDVLEVARQYKDWRYTTVLTLLQKLLHKGYVSYERTGRQYVFKPTLEADEFFEKEMNNNYSFFIEHNTNAVVDYLIKTRDVSDNDAKKLRKILS
jgi:BlaI family penicillinase repressor